MRTSLVSKRAIAVTVDDVDADLLSHAVMGKRNHVICGGCSHSRRRSVAKIIAARMLGREISPNERICFVNRTPTDLRRGNICVVSVSHRNRYPRPTTHSSRFKGVSWQKATQKWYAGIRLRNAEGGKGASRNLGRYAKEEDAAEAYNRAVLALGYDLAFLNDLDS